MSTALTPLPVDIKKPLRAEGEGEESEIRRGCEVSI